MKKLFTIVALATLMAAPAVARSFGFGVTAGMNVTKPESGAWKADSESGWYAGVKATATFPVIGLGFDVSMLFDQEVITATFPNETVLSDRVNYLSIPVNVHYQLSLPVVGKYVAPYVAVGPQLSAALSDSKEDKTDFDYDKTTWRLNFGGGVLLFQKLEVGYTYSKPLTNSLSTYGNDGVDIDFVAHRIGLTYYF